MSERIKQLSSEAFAYAVIHGRDYRPPTDFDFVYEKKLVELVVKDCIDCAAWVGTINKTPIEPIHTAFAIENRIKKHFDIDQC